MLRDKIGSVRADCEANERRPFVKISETRQARCRARLGDQTIRYYEIKTDSAYASFHSCIYVIYVISYLIPIFVGLAVCTLINRDFFVTNLNRKYPLIIVTDFRYVWN